MWLTLAKTIGGGLWGLLKPFLGPFVAYLKGRSDAKKAERLKNMEHFNEVANKADRIRRNAPDNRVPDDSDPNNRD